MLKNRRGGAIAAVILMMLIMFLAVDVGFTLYNPYRLASPLPSCTLSIFDGTVEVQTLETFTWEEAENGMILEPGSRVRTALDSHALLTFSQGTTTKLEPGTDLIVAKLESRQDNRPHLIVLKQRSGKTWNKVARLPGNGGHFEIQTPSASAKVRGTLFLAEVDESGKTLIQTAEGQVDVSAHGQEVQVSAGQQTEVELDSPPSIPVPTAPAKSELIVTVSRPAVGLVIDPSGSSAGYLFDGSELNQIAGSTLATPEESQYVIRIREPNEGEYTVVLRYVDDGISYFSIEGLAEGKSTFRYTGSSNSTTASELILRLHVDVLDGLLQGVPVLNPEPPKSQAIEETAVTKAITEETGSDKSATKSITEETGSDKSTTKSPDTDSERASVQQKGKPGELGETQTSPEGGYKYNQWFAAACIVIFFGIYSAVIWRKH